MVQVGAAFGYDRGVEEKEKPDQPWTSVVREAVREFVVSIGESSKHLALAAEKFASESLHLIDDAAETAQRSATTSSDMADAARRAADDARRAAETILQVVTEASLRVRDEARQAVQEAAGRAEQALQAGEQLKTDMQHRVDEAVHRMERSAGVSQEAATSAQQAATQARDAAERLERSMGSSQEVVAAVQQAVSEARHAASESSQNAARAEKAAAEQGIGASAQQVLERLEADYQLLTRLVQELHSRISGLAGQPAAAHTPAYSTEPPTPAQTYQPQPETPPAMEEHAAPVPTGAWTQPYREEAPPAQPPMAAPTPLSASPPPMPEAAPAPLPAPAPVTAPMSVAGRVLVSIAPVPDFDRLLNLDGALGRMAGVRNVSLADYAKEEVTFRIEVDQPMSPDEFSHRLSESAGARIDIASAAEGNLALRIVS